jgi:hypothetical protein
MSRLVFAICASLLLAGSALAQSTAEEPQALVRPSGEREGTTIVGERESPIGLYITPWRNAAPEKELDRPARFLDEALMPLDPDVFRRQLEYYNTITDHLRSRTAQPAAAAPR